MNGEERDNMAAASTPVGNAAKGKNGMRPVVKGWLDRAAALRWVLSVAAVALFIVALAGNVSWLVAAFGWLAVAGVAILVPVGRRNVPTPGQVGGQVGISRDAPGPGVQRLATALPDAAFLLTRDGRILFQNPSARTLFGAADTGRSMLAVLRAPEITAALREVARNGQPARVEYFERVPTDRWFEAHVVPLPDEAAAGAGGLLLLLRDLTRQHRTERMRADFVANASHELRTPLASLAGFIETLQGPAREDPQARARFLEIMRSQAFRMSRLIEDLLSLSRIELSAHEQPRNRIDLGEVVSYVVSTLTPLAQASGLELVFDRPPRGVPVHGARDELVQVFQNLVENAIKYGEGGGSVDIGMRILPGAGAGQVVVSVRDHGPGIAAEHLPRLTERFYRVDIASSREKGGTGLGLAIVKHILNRHRGTLGIDSTPGEGATFSVRLALAENENAAGEPAADLPG